MTYYSSGSNPVSILYKSIAGRYRPVRVADGPIRARYRFIKQFPETEERADNSNKTAYKICDRGHFEFISTSNFISAHSPSIYKLSMIRFVHKVHLDIDF